MQKTASVLVKLVSGILCRVCAYLSWLWKRAPFRRGRHHKDASAGASAVAGPGTVQVYILLGQSNMLGMGRIQGKDQDGTLECAVFTKKLYQYLIDHEDGNWVTSSRVRNVRVMDARGGGMHVYHNEFLTVRGDTIGPEIGIGCCLEQASAALGNSGSENNNKSEAGGDDQDHPPIMLLKSCIGNRSLGWDLLPPGSKQYEYKGKIYAGYGDSPAFWDKGTTPVPVNWYAGKQYDDDIANAKSVLAELDKYYPDASRHEVKGFFWWQGDKDRYTEAHAATYQRNLVQLIKQLRVEFNAPNAKFVLATLGQTDIEMAKGNEKLIMDAMFAVDGNSRNYPEFVGNVSTVYSHPLSKGGASNSHYNKNAETYMNIGEAMGRAMAELTTLNVGTEHQEELVV